MFSGRRSVRQRANVSGKGAVGCQCGIAHPWISAILPRSYCSKKLRRAGRGRRGGARPTPAGSPPGSDTRPTPGSAPAAVRGANLHLASRRAAPRANGDPLRLARAAAACGGRGVEQGYRRVALRAAVPLAHHGEGGPRRAAAPFAPRCVQPFEFRPHRRHQPRELVLQQPGIGPAAVVAGDEHGRRAAIGRHGHPPLQPRGQRRAARAAERVEHHRAGPRVVPDVRGSRRAASSPGDRMHRVDGGRLGRRDAMRESPHGVIVAARIVRRGVTLDERAEAIGAAHARKSRISSTSLRPMSWCSPRSILRSASRAATRGGASRGIR